MKIKTNSRLYNIFILYKTLIEYFSTTVYLLSVISVTKTRKIARIETIRKHSRKFTVHSRQFTFKKDKLC